MAAHRKIIPNLYPSTVCFHRTVVPYCAVCLFCAVCFVFPFSALGGTQGSALACGFLFPSMHFNELGCLSATEYQCLMAFAVWELLSFASGFCWAFWDWMLTIEIMHNPKQIREKLEMFSLHRKWKQRQARSISFFLFVFKPNVYPWDLWCKPFPVFNLSDECLWQTSWRFPKPQDPREMHLSFRLCSTELRLSTPPVRPFPLKSSFQGEGVSISSDQGKVVFQCSLTIHRKKVFSVGAFAMTLIEAPQLTSIYKDRKMLRVERGFTTSCFPLNPTEDPKTFVAINLWCSVISHYLTNINTVIISSY